MEDVETGLHDLARLVDELGITSIAVPPMGCGNGGLDWQQVRPLIITTFERSPQVEVQLFPPDGAPAAAEMATRTPRPTMTVAKAAFIATAQVARHCGARRAARPDGRGRENDCAVSVGLRPAVARVLEMTGVLAMFDVHDSVGSAVLGLQ